MNKALISLIGLLLAACLGLGYSAYSQTEKVTVLKEANKSLTEAADRAQARLLADRKVLVARQAKIVSEGRKLAQAQQALSEALQRNKSWSDTDVPPDVQAALGGPPGPVPDGL